MLCIRAGARARARGLRGDAHTGARGSGAASPGSARTARKVGGRARAHADTRGASAERRAG